jgi:NitT/TauT family transport system ATP-binding protein
VKLELRGVKRDFDARDGNVVNALDRVDLVVRDGEFVCVVGPSGCGKSTLLNLLAGLDSPSEGEVFADGEIVRGTDPSRALIFQDAALFPWLTVQANVEFGLRMRNTPRAEREAESRRLLDMVHLQGFARAFVHELSGGMKQRVAIARALAVDHLHGELQELCMRTKMTVVFVTHNVRESVVLGDRVLVMSPRPGRFVAEHVIDLPRPRRIDDDRTVRYARQIAADLTLDPKVPDARAR